MNRPNPNAQEPAGESQPPATPADIQELVDIDSLKPGETIVIRGDEVTREVDPASTSSSTGGSPATEDTGNAEQSAGAGRQQAPQTRILPTEPQARGERAPGTAPLSQGTRGTAPLSDRSSREGEAGMPAVPTDEGAPQGKFKPYIPKGGTEGAEADIDED